MSNSVSLYKFMHFYNFGILDVDRLVKRRSIELCSKNGVTSVHELTTIYSNNKPEPELENGEDEYAY